MSNIVITTLDAKALRTLRGRIERSGYNREQANYGIAWAFGQGFQSTDEAYQLAMSRILYSDDDLAEGVRFDGWVA